MEALGLIRTQVERCESQGVSLLCCPEAVLGGLADASDDPFSVAIPRDRLNAVLAPLSSDVVTTIVGFTERGDGRLYNAAAIFKRGAIVGVYRKLHPAINRSVYDPGVDVPVFRAGGLTFGVTICNDSNFAEPARLIAAQGAAAIFVPTNNELPSSKGGAELVGLARAADIARAIENRLWIIRADVAGRSTLSMSYGSSGVVNPDGAIVCTSRPLMADLLIAEIDPFPPRPRVPAVTKSSAPCNPGP